METIGAMDAINEALTWLNGYLWGWPMVVLLLGTHLYLTVRLRFIQRHIPLAVRLSVTRDPGAQGDVSQFGALTTALAATIGTGNIVGVATAVALGGPGAVLWTWLTGVFGIGNMVQANSIAELARETAGVQPWVTGVVLTALTALVILGGIRWITQVCERLVPLMAASYVAGCMVILALGWKTIPQTLLLIISSAFTGQAAVGGFAGATVMMAARYGTARGLFSNESGLGSAPIVAAAAQTRNPVRQALVSSTGTFWDTVVVCAMTGLVVVNTGAWREGLTGAALTHASFERIPVIGSAVLTFGLLTFVFTTIIGWEYYGERAVEYLFGKKAIVPYRVAWVAAVMLGSLVALHVVWNFADAANALMAIPNLVALLLLGGVIVRETESYLWSGRLDEASPPEEGGKDGALQGQERGPHH